LKIVVPVLLLLAPGFSDFFSSGRSRRSSGFGLSRKSVCTLIEMMSRAGGRIIDGGRGFRAGASLKTVTEPKRNRPKDPISYLPSANHIKTL
jgi:hypothetical protein